MKVLAVQDYSIVIFKLTILALFSNAGSESQRGMAW